MDGRNSVGLLVAALLLGTVPATGAQQLMSPEARATQRAERRREMAQMSPEEREKRRAQRRAERQKEKADKPPKPMELKGPFPLPVEVQNPSAPVTAGKPAGAACPSTDACTLKLTPKLGEVLVVTAVWSATKVQCDDLTTASPRTGAPMTVAWRCERQFVVEGPGAGYAGFMVGK